MLQEGRDAEQLGYATLAAEVAVLETAVDRLVAGATHYPPRRRLLDRLTRERTHSRDDRGRADSSARCIAINSAVWLDRIGMTSGAATEPATPMQPRRQLAVSVPEASAPTPKWSPGVTLVQCASHFAGSAVLH